ncbi:addiction module protein [Nannocystis radixulma]|uniref:Addiction module protein n=1 Tax=Nannocystis radixulma TaxID=2995305 RepID=A0ABT5B8K6_9BACT|nr:addiction module protein [Nannocystis radixulma]MDC0669854.1 addiction module protein [Nannocystis radixulma]
MASRAKPLEHPPALLEEPLPPEHELAEIEAAWEQEVLRIAAEHDAGRAGSVPWEQVRAELFGKRR